MFKKVVTTVLLGVTLVMSGCGSSDGEGESALETQQMLDNGEYTAVIAKLEASANSTSDYLSLAAAYMGKAGFSLSSIIGIVATSSDSDDDAFASFIENSKETSNSNSLDDLKTAVEYYQKVVLNKCLDQNQTLSGAEADLCLYVGLSKVSQTAVAISYIAEDVTVLSDNNRSDSKLTASTCAMQYAFDGSSSNVDANCSVSSESSITFLQSGKTYGDINITVGSDTFEYLLSGNSTPRSTALTNGFCTTDSFATRVDDINDTTYHVCPIDETNTTVETTTEDILVDTLNNGTDTVGAAVSDEVKADIDGFKNDVLAANGRSINDANTTISIEDIIKYLETNNN